MLSVSLLIRHLRCHLLRWRRLSLVPPTDLDFRKIPNQCTAQTQDSPLYGGGHEIDAPFIQQNKRISHGLFLYYRVRYIIASLREGGCAACGVGRRMRAVTHRTPSVASRQLPLQVGGAFHEVRRTVSSYCKILFADDLMEGGKPPPTDWSILGDVHLRWGSVAPLRQILFA